MTEQSISDRKRWFALAVLVAAQFMVVLDIAIVNVALPTIKTDLHFSQEGLQWVITAYSILFGGVLLLGGRAADLLGRRRMFMAGLTLFTVSSLLDGLAWSEGSLIAFRSLQGLGAALLAPAALSILTTTFEEGRERNLALGLWGAVSGSGAAAGVLLGGASDECLQLVVDLLRQRAGRRARARSQPIAAAREPRRPQPSPLRHERRHLDHGRAHAARVRTDPGQPARLGDGRHRRPARGSRGAHRVVRGHRAALARAPPADADLPHPHPDGLERDLATFGWSGVLAVLPADAVHAAGLALLRAARRARRT